MNKLRRWIVVAGLLAAAGIAWWMQQPPSRGAAPAERAGADARGRGGPVAVEVGRVERMRLEDDAQAVGSLRANQGVMLRPEASGRIVRLGFSDGQRIRRGQLLVQLDDALQQAQIKQAEAQAGIARTNLQRSRELVAQNFVSQSAVDQNAAALDVALAQVALARAQAARMKLFAPFDGIAGIKLVSEGDYVKDGADIVKLEDVSSVWVDFRLPERYLSRIQPGQIVEIALDALPGSKRRAKVVALDAQVDADGRSVLVRARMANGDGVLRSGMFARVRVVFSVREGALVVPEEALVPLGGKQFVIKLAPGERGPVSQRVEARIGQRADGKVEMLAGLAEGDAVVLAGQAGLMSADGQALRVVDVGRQDGRSGAAAAPAPAPGASGAGPARAASAV